MDITNLYNYKLNKTWQYNTQNPNNIVNFGTGTGIDGNRLRKSLTGIICPCCGIKMLSSKDIKSILNFPAAAQSKAVIPALGRFQEQLHPVEKDIYYTLKALSVDYPDLNLRELLNMERSRCLDILHDEERKIINRIRKIGHFLSETSMKKLEKMLQKAERFICQPEYSTIFKRRAFIARIADLTAGFPEKDAAETILGIARELPKAGNSKPAFVVKYTEVKPKTGIERNSHDIIKGILFPSLGTIEHVKIRSPRFKHGGGKNVRANYILECQRDNNLRDSKPFINFVRENPHFFGEHLQRYIDIIIDKINKGELSGLEDYPREIAQTLKNQSKGILQVDISKLKGSQEIKANH